jgi:hypothetical protein
MSCTVTVRLIHCRGAPLACTEEILAQLYAAQRNIAMGANVVKVVIDGEETSFGPGNPALLSALLSACESDLGLSATDSFFTFSTSKGFGL